MSARKDSKSSSVLSGNLDKAAATAVAGFVQIILVGLLALTLSPSVARAAIAPDGAAIIDQARLSFQPNNTTTTVVRKISNQVTVSLKSVTRTPSSIRFLGYSPGASAILAGPTQYSTDNGASFVTLPAASLANGSSLDPNQAQPLSGTDVFYPGQPAFVELDDADQNLDPTLRNTVTVRVSNGGQSLLLKLRETGVDTGKFAGYFLTSADSGNANGYTLAVTPKQTLSAKYVDPSDSSDSASATASVDPYNLVFDSSTGQPIDGAKITLVDAATGSPVTSFGEDGQSAFPASVVSGQSAKDSSGQAYPVSTGGFLFPRVPAGTYRLQITAPKGYQVDALATGKATQSLPGGPYLLGPASYGKTFTLTSSQRVGFDIPLSLASSQSLYIQLTGSSNQVAVGDMTQFVATVQNLDKTNAANQVQVVETLPAGFRYVKGSARLNGQVLADPEISSDGGQLRFNAGDIAAGDQSQVSFVAEVTATARLGRATTRAQASATGGVVSNTASFDLVITQDLMQSVNTLIGRVAVGCDKPSPDAPKDLSGIRLLMENGRYAVTDKKGRYHFAQVENGTHVVQVDPASLPPGYVLSDCHGNDRFAGRDNSQFVELHGGALWRADFHLRRLPPPSGSVKLRLLQKADGGDVLSTVALATQRVPVSKLAVMVVLPDGMRYQPGSARLDGATEADPTVEGNLLVFRIGDRPGGWNGKLIFSSRLQSAAATPGEVTTSAYANFATPSSGSQHTALARVSLKSAAIYRHQQRDYVISHYASGSAAVPEQGARQALKGITGSLAGAKNLDLDVTGYTDSVPMRRGARYTDNQQLSEARARNLAGYLKSHQITGPDARIHVAGKGAADPVASNASANGRAENRRVVAKAEYDTSEGQAPSGKAQSEEISTVTHGQDPAKVGATVPQPPQPDQDGDQKSEFKIDETWLRHTDARPEFVWPETDTLPATPSIRVAVKHAAGDRVELAVNGEKVSSRNFLKQKKNDANTVAVDEWLGVGLDEGDNLLTARIVHDGRVVSTLKRKVHYSGVPVRAEILPQKSWLVADGKNRPFLAVRFYDKWGYPVRPGVSGHYQLNAPYQTWQSVHDMQLDALSQVNAKPSYTIGRDGIGYIVLAPTTSSGQLTVTFPFQNGRHHVDSWIKPQQRDWVLVGLADGTAAFNHVRGHIQGLSGHDANKDIYQDGRVAFYAKGMIKGKYLLTAAYDSAKSTDVSTQGLQKSVDPNQYYMLYGDASSEGHDASSAKKLYLKIERGQFYALFGDYRTGLTVTDLSRYDRALTGLKSSYEGKHFGYTAFAANDSQAGVRDQIQGDGTSGLYHLSHKNIVINSETISLVTRDRYTNAVISTQTLSRYVDYTLDYYNGTLFFKQPVPSRDENFNPVYIEVQYEVENGDSKSITAGGRVALKLNDDKIELGATAVHEGAPGSANKLYGADFRADLTSETTLKAEVAHTVAGDTGTSQSVISGASTGSVTHAGDSGNAYEISLRQQSKKLDGKLYYRKEDAAFGLGQQSLGDQGLTRYGADGRYALSQVWSVNGKVSRQSGNGAYDNTAESGIGYQGHGKSLSAGLRHTASQTDATAAVSSDQIYLGGSMAVSRKLSVHGLTNQTVSGGQDPLNPTSTTLGADYAVTKRNSLFLDQEFAGGSDQGYSRMTEFGVHSRLWSNTQVTSALAQQQTEYGPRLFSTMGLKQGWKLDDHWNLDAGMSRSQTIRAPAASLNAALPGTTANTTTEDFTSGFLGSSYQGGPWLVNNRVEYLTSTSEQRHGLFAGVYRDLSSGSALSASLKWFDSRFTGGSKSTSITARFGFAHRPEDSRWSLLEQLDLIYTDQAGNASSNTGIVTSQQSPASVIGTSTSSAVNQRSWKLVNNVQGNYTASDWQWSVYYGAKYARYTFDSGGYDGYTDLTGSEWRYDFTPHWDAGIRVNVMHSWRSGTFNEGYGVEIGHDFATNMWVSIGYNFKGSYDQDFNAAHYIAQGAFLRFRFKFDQDTVKAMAKGFGG